MLEMKQLFSYILKQKSFAAFVIDPLVRFISNKIWNFDNTNFSIWPRIFSILLSNLLKKIEIQVFFDTEATTARRKKKIRLW